jgi:hypothetical protein
VIAATLTGSASASSATRTTMSRPSGRDVIVSDHANRHDGPLTSMRILRDRLFVAFWNWRTLGSVDLPTDGGDYQLDGIQDGSDGVDPLGAKDNGIRSGGPAPATTRTPAR